MKKLIPIFIFIYLIAHPSFAQNVGVGNTTPASKLDVSGDLALREGSAILVAAGSNALTLPTAKNSIYRLTGATGPFSISSISPGNDGMLLTLINATGQVMTVSEGSIETGTGADLVGASTASTVNLIYNTTLSKWLVASGEGFTTPGNGWNLTGNSATNSSNFLGTTDANPLNIKTNNAQVAYFPASDSGNIIVGRNSPIPAGNLNVTIGDGSGNATSTGTNNIAIGMQILNANTTGKNNTAIGYRVLYGNTVGNSNVAIGTIALPINSNGGNNVALGAQVLQNSTSGNSNVAIGSNALTSLVSGNNNVAIGNNAGYSTTGTNSVFLGNSAGRFETGSNKLYISNSGTATPLIYGDFSNNHLTVNDSLTAKYLQFTYGASAGYLLQSDASGNGKWVSPSSITANNIYSIDGTLAGNRTVTMGGNNLNFSSSSGSFSYNTTGAASVTLGNNLTATGTNNFVTGINNTAGGLYTTVGGNSNSYPGGYAGAVFGTSNTVSAGASNVGVFGDHNLASGNNSFVTGYQDTASGNYSMVTGTQNKVSGNYAFVSGGGNKAAGNYSVVLNNTNSTSSAASTSIAGGFQSYVSANLGVAIGWADTASGQAAMAVGNGNVAPSYSELVAGSFATDYTPSGYYAFSANDRAFNVGNGLDNSHRSDAFTVFKNGNVGIGNSSPTSKLQVNGTTTTTNLQITNGANAGYVLQSDASGNGIWVNPSTVTGPNIYNSDGTLTGNRVVTQGADDIIFGSTSGNFYYNTSGTGNVAMGKGLNVSGANNTAVGNGNTVSGSYNFVSGAGNNATGTYSLTGGINNKDLGTDDVVGGTNNYVTAGYGHSIVVGNTDTITGSAGAAFGYLNKILQFEGFAQGDRNTSGGQAAAVFGSNNTAAAGNSFVIGHSDTAYGSQGFAQGTGVTSESWSEAALGTYNTLYTPSSTSSFSATDRLFDIGNGTSASSRSDAFTILKNGNVGIRTSSPAQLLDVNGTTKTINLQMTNGATNGYILQSDASGNGTWVSPSSITTTNTLTNTINTITSTVNGVSATAPAVNINVLSISGDSITSTINGVASNKLSLSASNWSLNGNSGTTSSNFIGTTDTNALYFKTNNKLVGYLPNAGSANILFGYNRVPASGTNSVYIGSSSATANTNGDNNVAIGSNTLKSNVSGYQNVAIGASALSSSTTGQYNVGIGQNVLGMSTTGSNNTGVGTLALSNNTTGSGNTALGINALHNDTSGNLNVAIGNGAGNNAIGSGNIFLGYQAGYDELGNNKLYISNSNTAIPLMYGDFTNRHLTINDSLTAKYLQMTNGATNGYILKSDASGNASWVNPNTIASQNIYNTDGSLTGNRTVTQGGNNITFSSTSGNFYYTPTAAGNVAMGKGLTVTGTNNFVTGIANTASGQYTTVGGNSNSYPAGNAGAVFGTSNTVLGGANNVGVFGDHNVTSGNNTIVTGYQDTASGGNSLLAGQNNNVSGTNSVALGFNNKVSGSQASAIGGGHSASGNYSVVLNNNNSSTYAATTSIAGGFQSQTANNLAVAIGWADTASGVVAMAIGRNNNAASYAEFVGGTFATNYTPSSTSGISSGDRLFNIGNGTSASNRADAFTILKNGNVGIGIASPSYKLDVAGDMHASDNVVAGGNAYIGQDALVTNGVGIGTTSPYGRLDVEGSYCSFQVYDFSASLGTTLAAELHGKYSAGPLLRFSGGGPSFVDIGQNGNGDFIINEIGTSLLISQATGYVGINNTSPTQVLDVSGTTKTTDLQLTDGATSGYILQSDASGNASWVNPTGITTATTVSNLSSGNNLTTTVNSISAAPVPLVNTVSNTSSANTLITKVNGVAASAVNIVNTNTASWTQSAGLTTTVNGISATTTPASGTVTNVLGYSSSGAPVYQSTTAMTHAVSNTVGTNTISTTVDGTTGAAVNVPNIYTSDGTLTGSRTVTQGANNLTLSSTTGNFVFNPTSTTGAMGIGVTAPSARLHVLGTTNNQLILESSSATGTWMLMKNSGGGTTWNLISTGSSNSEGSGNLLIKDNSAVRMMLQSSTGNVGIGTTNPQQTLTIVNASGVYSGIESSTHGLSIETGQSSGDYIMYMGADKTNHVGYIQAVNYGCCVASLALNARGGNVGIGTYNPGYPLDIEAQTGNYSGSFAFYAKNGNSTTTGIATGTGASTSIYAVGRVVAAEFDAYSDARIKKDRTPSDSQQDLNTLMDLKPVEFRYIDEVQHGRDLKKGFIAQEVQQVYPQAVQTSADFVPSVYQMSSSISFDTSTRSMHIKVAKPHGLMIGDKVKTLTESSGKVVNTVTAVYSDTEFALGDWTDTTVTGVFVFGKEVPDFHTVDYDRIYTLNVSATQELARRLIAAEQSNKDLKAKLESAVNELHTAKADASELQNLKAEVETLKSILMPLTAK